MQRKRAEGQGGKSLEGPDGPVKRRYMPLLEPVVTPDDGWAGFCNSSRDQSASPVQGLSLFVDGGLCAHNAAEMCLGFL